MTHFRIALRNKTRNELEKRFQRARNRGDLATVIRIMAITAVAKGNTYLQVRKNRFVSGLKHSCWKDLKVLYRREAQEGPQS